MPEEEADREGDMKQRAEATKNRWEGEDCLSLASSRGQLQ